MHRATFLLISIILALVMVAALITAGILTGKLWMYVLALGVSVLLLVVFLGFYFWTYRRIMARVGTANERLSEIKLLQERRYAQLAQRLDALDQGTFGQPNLKPSDAEHLIARVERAERRILGRLENLSLDNDTRLRTVEKLVSKCSDYKTPE